MGKAQELLVHPDCEMALDCIYPVDAVDAVATRILHRWQYYIDFTQWKPLGFVTVFDVLTLLYRRYWRYWRYWLTVLTDIWRLLDGYWTAIDTICWRRYWRCWRNCHYYYITRLTLLLTLDALVDPPIDAIYANDASDAVDGVIGAIQHWLHRHHWR